MLTPSKYRLHYYPFGSSLNTRSFSAGSGFRFGFNGKENFDKYQDYGFRIYYPELGKFLSVDPLKKSFSWNGSYSFAENKPLKSVDLDGLEEISINTQSNQMNFVKLTTINISMVYYLVTKGKGAIDDFPFQNFNDHMSGEMTIYLTKLPSPTNELEAIYDKKLITLSKKAANGDENAIIELKKLEINEVYKATVQFDIKAEEFGTIEESMDQVSLNSQKYGLIMNQMTNAEITQVSNEKMRSFLESANEAFKDPRCGGFGSWESNLQEETGRNYIVLPISTTMTLSRVERAAHEVGHNLSIWHCHSADNINCHSVDFEYDDEGLGSNTDPQMSKQNLINTLNDSRNRKTIKQNN